MVFEQYSYTLILNCCITITILDCCVTFTILPMMQDYKCGYKIILDFITMKFLKDKRYSFEKHAFLLCESVSSVISYVWSTWNLIYLFL